eukprot:scaffold241513_cov23-Tisochrysis_lutea.AAC.1
MCACARCRLTAASTKPVHAHDACTCVHALNSCLHEHIALLAHAHAPGYKICVLAGCGSCPPPDEASAFHPCRSTLLVYAHSVYNTCAGRMRRLPSTLA